ncbi:BQ5605_C033g11225 [Microbotryum silenes-dioicae]|uniref:BQ5605_C033g11225 protein n=1 Tax=Microbotryum silenes-dioicae TaxID=796604 RepID=A0A2X0MKV4_9BASI|nr:BQ5605_C033g11225 [Microbotryum silenes-dioicae]
MSAVSGASTSLLTRLESQLRTPNGKLVLVALATTLLTTGTILTTQKVRRKKKRGDLREVVERRTREEDEGGEEEMLRQFVGGPLDDGEGALSENAEGGDGVRSKSKKPTNEVIIREALARNYVFFGEGAMAMIRGAFVVVVGLGGVGSACATMLVRSGVRKVRLIDFDQVSLSSLNRHSTANLAQVGTPKVISCADYFASIAPWVEVDARNELFSKEDADTLLEGVLCSIVVATIMMELIRCLFCSISTGKPDYVIDAIDNIDSKVDLLVYCHKHHLPVFSSLGAAAKSDPSRIQVSDISTTFEDPLARVVRRRLKLEGVHSGVPVVYSTEKPRDDLGLLPLPEEEFQKGKVDELAAIQNFRVRILPVLGPLPAMFGNAAATYVLQALAGFKMEPLPVKNRHKMAATIHRQLAAVEIRLSGLNKIPMSEDDVLYLFEEVFRARSVAPLLGLPSRPCLLRWEKEGGLRWDNLVVFDRAEGEIHEKEVLIGDKRPEELWGPEVTALVQKRHAEERRLRKYRIE